MANQDQAKPEQTDSERRDEYESTPITRAEYISAIVHLYRGELSRANSWRIRLDNTTNWAVLTSAGLLSFAFGQIDHSHWILLVGLALITILMAFEARRYRFWHVWRSRVRMIEENFYGPILRRNPKSPEEDWGTLVADDLFHPSFKISRMEALRARLLKNYWAIIIVLITAWIVKVSVHPTPAGDFSAFKENLEVGLVPWWGAIAYVATFLVAMLTIALIRPKLPHSESDYWDSNGNSDHEVTRESLEL